MIYSIDDRDSWQRFNVLGWDRFLYFISKAGLEASDLVPYLKLSDDFEAPVTDFISVPMLFKRGSKASDGLRDVLTTLATSILRDDPGDSSPDVLRKAGIGESLTDEQLSKAMNFGDGKFLVELSYLNYLLEAGDVWVGWPNARRSLRVSSRPEVNKKGKRLFDDWRIFTSARRWGVSGDSPDVNVVLRRSKQRNDSGLSVLQKSVLWRSTHLAAIQAFADFAVCLLHPETTRSRTPAIGGAIAVRAVMELTAHYLNSPGDPFDTGENFMYRENLELLRLGEAYDAISECLKANSYWRPSPPIEDDTRLICDKALSRVWNVLNTSQSTSAIRGLTSSDTSVGFEPSDTNVLDYSRTSIDQKDFDSQVEVAAFGYEWLCELWTKEPVSTQSVSRLPVTPYEVNKRVFCWDLKPLIESVENYRNSARSEFERPLEVIGALLRAFCLASNLAPLCAGAIARELHLHVEELMVRAEHCERYSDRELKEIKKSHGRESQKYRIEKEKQDDKSLKCIEDELVRPALNLNALRVRLQDVLQSFAHPGWLIRTETARFSEPEPEISQVRISGWYQSPFAFADIDPLTCRIIRYPYAEQRETNSFFTLFREHVPRDVSEAMRQMLSQESGGKALPGSAYEIPHAAVQICAIAIQYFMRVGPKKTDS
jgi:hypothetical protein